jgi:hypothetical protein
VRAFTGGDAGGVPGELGVVGGVLGGFGVPDGPPPWPFGCCGVTVRTAIAGTTLELPVFVTGVGCGVEPVVDGGCGGRMVGPTFEG